MTARDRLVLTTIVVLALLAGAWFLAVAPEREKAAALNTQVSTAAAQLQSAEGSLASARHAEAEYPAAYAAIVNLGKAVPASEEVPSLLYQLAHVADAKHVEFGSITNGSAGGATATATATAEPSSFTQMPFTLTFSGTYSDLYELFRALDSSTVRSASGALDISGRLLTIQSVKLTPAETSGTDASGKVAGTINATAYVLPAGQGLTPTSSTSPSTAAPSTTPATTSPTTPAVVTP
jgi:Tfp pilus assembly protein PilO